MYILHGIVWIKPKHVVTAITFLIYAGKLRLNLLRLKKVALRKTAWKVPKYRVFSSLYSVLYGKIRTRKNSLSGHFSRSYKLCKCLDLIRKLTLLYRKFYIWSILQFWLSVIKATENFTSIFFVKTLLESLE